MGGLSAIRPSREGHERRNQDRAAGLKIKSRRGTATRRPVARVPAEAARKQPMFASRVSIALWRDRGAPGCDVGVAGAEALDADAARYRAALISYMDIESNEQRRMPLPTVASGGMSLGIRKPNGSPSPLKRAIAEEARGATDRSVTRAFRDGLLRSRWMLGTLELGETGRRCGNRRRSGGEVFRLRRR